MKFLPLFFSMTLLSISSALTASPRTVIAVPVCLTFDPAFYLDCVVQTPGLITEKVSSPPDGCIKNGPLRTKFALASTDQGQDTGVPEEPCKFE